MKILLDDFIQYSDAPNSIKTPALADDMFFTTYTFTLDVERTFDSIGIGNCDSPTVDINGELITLHTGKDKNGLYLLPVPQTTDTVIITFPANTQIGRIAVGLARQLGGSPAREPGFWSTNKPRRTLSEQVIGGIGGATGRKIQMDFRYKFTREIFEDIENAYSSQIGRGYPFFISFTDCNTSDRYPWERLYGSTKQDFTFQGSTNSFLFSKKMNFREAF